MNHSSYNWVKMILRCYDSKELWDGIISLLYAKGGTEAPFLRKENSNSSYRGCYLDTSASLHPVRKLPTQKQLFDPKMSAALSAFSIYTLIHCDHNKSHDYWVCQGHMCDHIDKKVQMTPQKLNTWDFLSVT